MTVLFDYYFDANDFSDFLSVLKFCKDSNFFDENDKKVVTSLYAGLLHENGLLSASSQDSLKVIFTRDELHILSRCVDKFFLSSKLTSKEILRIQNRCLTVLLWTFFN